MNNPNLRRGSQGGWADRLADESGQILTITGLAMVLMLCCAGLVVDVGHAMLVQRQLQAGVDAAALAGVQHLPDVPVAESVAVQYSATPGSKNAVNTVNNATTVAKAACLVGVPGCNRRDGGVNGITVQSKSDVPTWFGKIIGINKISVSAKAVACSPCTVKPLDIMIVLDRTGSMCAPIACAPGNQSDLFHAKEGVKTFLGFLDPSLDRVGLALLPPVLDATHVADCPYTPTQAQSYYGYDHWWHPDGLPKPPGGPTAAKSSYYVVASMEGAGTDPSPNGSQNYYLVDVNGTWTVNDGTMGTNGQSAFVQRLGCAGGAGNTHYALAVEEAQRELVTHGRGNVQDIIIFLSDGAANTMPQNVPQGHWTQNGPNGWIKRPCGAGVESARRIKNAGTLIYTIGYDLDAGSGAPEQCRQPDAAGHNNTNIFESGCGFPPGGWGDGSANPCNAYAAIQAMATDPDGPGNNSPPYFYNKPNPGDLTQIFTQIAKDLSGSRGRLIDSTSPNLLAGP